MNQVCHADIKPANILVGPGERGILADFDISVDSSELPPPTVQPSQPECCTMFSLDAAGSRVGLARTDQNSRRSTSNALPQARRLTHKRFLSSRVTVLLLFLP